MVNFSEEQRARLCQNAEQFAILVDRFDPHPVVKLTGNGVVMLLAAIDPDNQQYALGLVDNGQINKNGNKPVLQEIDLTAALEAYPDLTVDPAFTASATIKTYLRTAAIKGRIAEPDDQIEARAAFRTVAASANAEVANDRVVALAAHEVEKARRIPIQDILTVLDAAAAPQAVSYDRLLHATVDRAALLDVLSTMQAIPAANIYLTSKTAMEGDDEEAAPTPLRSASPEQLRAVLEASAEERIQVAYIAAHGGYMTLSRGRAHTNDKPQALIQLRTEEGRVSYLPIDAYKDFIRVRPMRVSVTGVELASYHSEPLMQTESVLKVLRDRDIWGDQVERQSVLDHLNDVRGLAVEFDRLYGGHACVAGVETALRGHYVPPEPEFAEDYDNNDDDDLEFNNDDDNKVDHDRDHQGHGMGFGY